MGSDIQKECDDCCRYDYQDDSELEKDRAYILRGPPKKNGGEVTVQSNHINDLTFIDNNAKVASIIITNPKIYEKMNKGERLHQILEPLTSFINKNLLELVNLLLIKITELNNHSSLKNEVYNLFEKNYKELISCKIIDNLTSSDLGYFTKIKFNLIYIIEIIAELYHYFSYQLNNGTEPYNVFYWDYIKNPISYMKEKVNDLLKCIKDMNNYVVENKSKNMNNSVDIHITANNFNIQMEQ